MRGRVLLFLTVLLCVAPRVEAFIALNEILADPAAGLAGDSNNDGIRDTSDDEFIELVNPDNSSVDISGWRLTDSTTTRHIFPANTILDPYNYIVIFGGGSPFLPGINWQTASTPGLSLNNTADTISFFDLNNQLIDQLVYGALANNDQAIVRSPEASGSWVLHNSVPENNNALFSPGKGLIKAPEQHATVPEPMTLSYFLAAGFAGFARRILRK